MGIAATGSPELAFDVARATGLEVSAVGVNMILGPVLDVLSKGRYQPLGVRATGDDPQEVSQYGIAAMNGYKDVGLTTCGKHFPSYGNLDFLGSSLDMPIITETLEQLSLSALVPFRNAVAAGIDAIMVGGCAIANTNMNVMHACLSEQVVDDLLRRDLGFDGVVISECLEMDALSHDIGVRGGTVMAVEAGCDLVLLCRSFSVQQEAISGLKAGIENDMVSTARLRKSLKRVLRLKAACTSWQQALNPLGINLLSTIHDSHLALSRHAYDNSITVMRDTARLLPLSSTLPASEELLLLTPLLKPLPASAATKFLSSGENTLPPSSSDGHDRWTDRSAIMSGEGVFRELGRSLAKRRHGKLLHTSYTANGVRPTHEHLIERASAIIIVTADANRNLYQSGFTKHVNMMCSLLSRSGGAGTQAKKKNLIVVSVSSPYDFAMDKSIGTYVCTYDFTEAAMAALVRVLFGEFVPRGSLPGTIRRSRKVLRGRQNWLVESYDSGKDARGLDALILAVQRAAGAGNGSGNGGGATSPLQGASAGSFELRDLEVEEAFFVVRNSSTGALYGFCATYVHIHSGTPTGYIGALFVDPSKRNLSIGHSLYQRAVRGLRARQPPVQKLRLGIALPSIFPGIPTLDTSESSRLTSWFTQTGLIISPSSSSSSSSSPRVSHSLVIRRLADWTPPEPILKSVQRLQIDFDLVHGSDHYADLAPLLGPETWEKRKLYQLALADPEACGIVRAKSRVEGKLVGCVIICRHGSQLGRYVPFLNSPSGMPVGGVLAPVVSGEAGDRLGVLQGLSVLGVRQNKAHRAGVSYMNMVSDHSQMG
jgi:beta-N-acetylhexosaminidase